MATKSTKAAKRRVKNPETFRERALKTTENDAQANRATKAKRAGGKTLAPVVRPVQKFSGKVASTTAFKLARKPFRLLGKILLPSYIRSSWRELRLVAWPDWKQSRRLTVAVLGFAIVFGAVIALVDFGLDKLFKEIILK
ncbi:MAG: preprotein translocase subunit SecE [Candidatus Saccharimonadales bacterium]